MGRIERTRAEGAERRVEPGETHPRPSGGIDGVVGGRLEPPRMGGRSRVTVEGAPKPCSGAELESRARDFVRGRRGRLLGLGEDVHEALGGVAGVHGLQALVQRSGPVVLREGEGPMGRQVAPSMGEGGAEDHGARINWHGYSIKS